MILPYASILAFIAIGAAIFFWSSARTKKMLANRKTPEQLTAMFHEAFETSRLRNEEEPVCVMAYHNHISILVGVTDLRVLVQKENGPMVGFDYDDEGEHLPSAEKNKQKRGYFRWSHQKGIGYTPTVVNGPFAGEEWVMPLQVPGFAAQKSGLEEFSSRFYFAWFY
jgi:hypothetical protein